MGLPQPKTRYAVEAYLEFERQAEDRHEYLDGNIYAMAGESPEQGLDASLHLASIPCTLLLADIYDRIVFPTEEPGLVQQQPAGS